MPLEAIIFDLDGTILDTTGELTDALSKCSLKLINKSIDPDLMKSKGLLGAPLDEICKSLIMPHSDRPEAEVQAEFASTFITLVNSEPPSPAFKDVIPGLLQLKSWPGQQHIKFAVATTKPTATANADLSSKSVPDVLRTLFDFVQGTEDDIKPKVSEPPDFFFASLSARLCSPSPPAFARLRPNTLLSPAPTSS